MKHRVEVVELNEDELDYEGTEEIYSFKVIVEFGDNLEIHIPSDQKFHDEYDALETGKEHSLEMIRDVCVAIQQPVVDAIGMSLYCMDIPVGLL